MDTTSLILTGVATYGISLLAILAICIVIGVGMLIYKVGKDLVYKGAFGATFDHYWKLPYKGYNRFRSRKWNMEHTS